MIRFQLTSRLIAVCQNIKFWTVKNDTHNRIKARELGVFTQEDTIGAHIAHSS